MMLLLEAQINVELMPAMLDPVQKVYSMRMGACALYICSAWHALHAIWYVQGCAQLARACTYHSLSVAWVG
jgi:hypothetical protein